VPDPLIAQFVQVDFDDELKGNPLREAIRYPRAVERLAKPHADLTRALGQRATAHRRFPHSIEDRPRPLGCTRREFHGWSPNLSWVDVRRSGQPGRHLPYEHTSPSMRRDS